MEIFSSSSDEEDLFNGKQSGSDLKHLFGTEPPKSAPNPTQIKNDIGDSLQENVSLNLSGPLIVDAFLFDGATNTYKAYGKAGFLITLSKNQTDVVVLYRSKTQTLASAKIASDQFRFEIQSDVFSSFTDSSSRIWSVKFASPNASEQFSANVALARLRADQHQTVQELNPGTKSADAPSGLTKDDRAQFRIFSWRINEDAKSFGDVLQNGDTITLDHEHPWMKYVLGIKLDGSRLLLVRAESLSPELREKCSGSTWIAMKLVLLQKVEMSTAEENSVELRTKSRLDDLVSKIGRPLILPDSGNRGEENISNREKEKINKNDESSETKFENSTLENSKPLPPQRKPELARAVNSEGSVELARMVFSEQRLHNADMKISIKRIEDKVDLILKNFRHRENESTQPDLCEKSDEPTTNISRLEEEVECLKKSVALLSSEKARLEVQLQDSSRETSDLKKKLASAQQSGEDKIQKVVQKVINRTFKSLKVNGEIMDENLKIIGSLLKETTEKILSEPVDGI